MKKLLFVLMVLCGGFSGLVASDATTEKDLKGGFQIILESEQGDYIGQGKDRLFDDSDDYLSFRKAYSRDDDQGVIFVMESFDITYSLSLEPEGGLFKKGMYYPAKRFPFNDRFNGLDLSGGGRGCNKSVGGFYVHELVMDDNYQLVKAAIDFVQACENHDAALYGSLRYNTSIKNKCDANGCSEVKELFSDYRTPLEVKSDVNDADVFFDSEQQEKAFIDDFSLVGGRIEKAFPVFYNACVQGEFVGTEVSNMSNQDDSGSYLNIAGCKGKYRNELSLANMVLEKILGPRTTESDDTSMTDRQKEELLSGIAAMNKKIYAISSSLTAKGKMTTQLDIVLGGVVYFMEMGMLGIEYFL